MSAPPPDQGYPPQQGYPPPQPGYPPEQQGYPPPQPGYPPEQQGYPPPQQGYPPEQKDAYPPPYQPQPGYPGPPPPAASYPPQGSYPPPQQQQQATTTVVVQQQPTVTVNLRGVPVTLDDGSVTILRYKTGLLSWIVVGILCLVLLECGLCCFAFLALLFDGLKDIEHVHPVTGQVVGVYRRI